MTPRSHDQSRGRATGAPTVGLLLQFDATGAMNAFPITATDTDARVLAGRLQALAASLIENPSAAGRIAGVL